jgi:ferritin-like metal-binding protein YciE
MPMKTLADAFYDELRDIYHAEKQLLEALPKMAKKAGSDELRTAIEEHLAETEMQVQRLENAFTDTGKAARGKKCEGMAGLIEEGSEINGDSDADVVDAVLIAAAQKVEHYEIAAYGTLCTWADLLGYRTAKSELAKNLAEEKAADEKLSALAKNINADAQA